MDRSGLGRFWRRQSRAALVVVALVLGCAPRVPVPESASNEGDVPIPVPYPPPAARSEKIPPQPDEDAVWVDGYWMWRGSTYSWSAGRWVQPPRGMRYAPATLLRLRNGDLVFYAPKWTKPSQKD